MPARLRDGKIRKGCFGSFRHFALFPHDAIVEHLVIGLKIKAMRLGQALCRRRWRSSVEALVRGQRTGAGIR